MKSAKFKNNKMSQLPLNQNTKTTFLGDISFETFYTRPGTTDEGRIFEALNVANICFDLVFNDDISDFSLSSNDVRMGDFDDIVLNLTFKNGTKKKFAMQLKYKSSSKRILTIDSLMADRGDYSLKKYCEDYNKITDKQNLTTILLVKKCFDAKTIKQTGMTIKEKRKKLPFLRKDKCYRFKRTDGQHKLFFENFLLYTTETDVKEIEKNISNKFCNKFCFGAKANGFINFVKEWCFQNAKQKVKFNKSFLRRVIGLNLLDPFIQKLSFAGTPSVEKLLFVEASLALAVTPLGFDKKEEIVDIGVDVRGQLPDVAVCQKMSSYYQLNQDSSQFTGKVLWLTHKCPLIVTDNRIVRKTIDLCYDMKFIVLIKENEKKFCFLNDLKLKLPGTHDAILNKFQCKLQGKSIRLKELLSLSENIDKLISTDELVLMMKNKLEIGRNTEILPASHTNRFMSQNIIEPSILDTLDRDTIIVITCSANVANHLEARCKHKDNIEIKKEKISQKQFEDLCSQNPSKHHQLRFTEKGKFEWVRSNCDTTKLQNYLSENWFLPENELPKYEDDVNVNIVCGGPGMGKSTLMYNFYNNVSPKLWTILFEVRYHIEHFVEKGDNLKLFEEYLLQTHKVLLKPFEFELFKVFMKNGKIRVLWDGLDELSDDNYGIVKSIIQQFSKNGSKHWVTSRDILKADLEEQFKVISRTLKTFDENEQKLYIQDRLKLSLGDTLTIFQKVKHNIQLSSNNDILGIPLQIYLLTDLFIRNFEKYFSLLDGMFTIAELYEHFVHEKFIIYRREKENVNRETDISKKRNEIFFRKAIDVFERTAMQIYFDGKLKTLDVGSLDTDQEEFAEVGIILKFDKKVVQFFHNTFGEFFAACYLAKHCLEISHFQNFFFFEKYDNIRFFFDLLLSKNCKAHVAVLYRNWDLLETCEERDFGVEDKEGRNALQLMCSWGAKNRFPTSKTDNVFILPQTVQILTTEAKKNIDYISKLELLSKRIDPEKQDKLYGLDAFCYACKTRCFLSLGIVTSISEIVCDKFGENSSNVLFHCILHDYFRVFDVMKTIPKIQMVYHQGSPFIYRLPQILTLFNAIQCLTHILSKNFLRKMIDMNMPGGHGKRAIHHACEKGNLQIVRLLVAKGFPADVPDCDQMKPISYACVHGHFEIAKFLVENGVDIHCQESKYYGRDRPIHLACFFGRFDIAQLLINKGVNVNVFGSGDNRPIHYACGYGNLPIVQLLMEKGADADFPNPNMERPIHRACMEGHLDVVKYLVKKGISADIPKGLRLPNHTRPIHLACKHNNLELAEFLIDKVDLKAKDENDWTPVHHACQSGSLDILKLLIKNGANAKAQDKYQKTPIYYACKSGHLQIVKWLIEKSIKIGDPTELVNAAFERKHFNIAKLLIQNVKKTYKNGPIHLACETGQLEIVKLLLQKQAKPDIPDEEQNRPIHLACKSGSLEIVRLLLFDKNVQVDVTDQQQNTPIHLACKTGHAEVVQLLLEKGANADIPNEDQNRPIHLACETGNIEIVKLLLEKRVNADIPNQQKDRPIHLACKSGNFEIVKLLIKKQVNLDVADGNQNYPIHYAWLSQCNEIIKLLIEKGANVDVFEVNQNKLIHEACKFGYLDIIKLLLMAGVKADEPDQNQKTPIHYACENGHLEVVKLLMEKEINMDMPDNFQNRPIHYACKDEHFDVAKFLIEEDVSVNEIDEDGRIPIHYACRSEKFEIVKMLLGLRSGVNVPDKNRNSPIHLACRIGHHDIVKLLLKKGAQVDVVDSTNMRPIDYAKFYNYDKIIDLLIAVKNE